MMSNNFNLDKISSIGSNVNLSEVPQIGKKRLLTFINDFVVSTVSFLNKFALSCESRLREFDVKMQKLDAELCIIEAKLNSIPGLEVEVNELKSPETVTVDDVNLTSNESNAATATVNIEVPSLDEPDLVEESEVKQDETAPAIKNPELAKYFKMVHLGVPLQAVKLKMQMEGFDPNLIDG